MISTSFFFWERGEKVRHQTSAETHPENPPVQLPEAPAEPEEKEKSTEGDYPRFVDALRTYLRTTHNAFAR